MKVAYTIETEKTASKKLPALYQYKRNPDFIVFFATEYIGVIVEESVGRSSSAIGTPYESPDSCFSNDWVRLEKDSSVTFIQEG
jgi:hypothetical protein